MSEKQRLNMEDKHANRLYELKACEMDQRAVELAIAEEETKRAINTATKDYNLALVSVKLLLVLHYVTVVSTIVILCGIYSSFAFELYCEIHTTYTM